MLVALLAVPPKSANEPARRVAVAGAVLTRYPNGFSPPVGVVPCEVAARPVVRGERRIPDCQTAAFDVRLRLAMRYPKLGDALFGPEVKVCAAKMELVLRYADRPELPRPALCAAHFGACTRV